MGGRSGMGVRLDLRAGRRPSCYCRDSGSRLAGARNGQAAGSDPGCGDRAQPGERLGRRGAAPSIGRPVIEHWNGHRWSVSKLPTGLSGAGRGAERQQLEQRLGLRRYLSRERRLRAALERSSVAGDETLVRADLCGGRRGPEPLECLGVQLGERLCPALQRT